MTLDELERLLKAARPGPWSSDDVDAALVCAMRNNIDALLEIARAAEDCAFYYGGDEHSGPIKRLKGALAKLEGEVKTCTKCKKAQPLSHFSKNRMAKDGIHYRCKTCMAETREYRKQFVTGVKTR